MGRKQPTTIGLESPPRLAVFALKNALVAPLLPASLRAIGVWLGGAKPSACVCETSPHSPPAASVTGKPLFSAPRGRTFEAFVKESKVHGWPSFRDEEVVWDNVRCLRDGECVSLTGVHSSGRLLRRPRQGVVITHPSAAFGILRIVGLGLGWH